jgi:hypothetical protein
MATPRGGGIGVGVLKGKSNQVPLSDCVACLGQLEEKHMTPENAFVEAIHELEEQLRGKKLRLDKELADVESKDVLLAERDAASRAKERSLNFRPMLGGNYQCPSCWIMKEERSAMRCLRARTDDDFFQCRACKFEVRVPRRLYDQAATDGFPRWS